MPTPERRLRPPSGAARAASGSLAGFWPSPRGAGGHTFRAECDHGVVRERRVGKGSEDADEFLAPAMPSRRAWRDLARSSHCKISRVRTPTCNSSRTSRRTICRSRCAWSRRPAARAPRERQAARRRTGLHRLRGRGRHPHAAPDRGSALLLAHRHARSRTAESSSVRATRLGERLTSIRACHGLHVPGAPETRCTADALRPES